MHYVSKILIVTIRFVKTLLIYISIPSILLLINILFHIRFKSSFLIFKLVLYKCISNIDIRNSRMTIPTIMCNDETIFLPSVTGYTSRYPIVVTVAIAL